MLNIQKTTLAEISKYKDYNALSYSLLKYVPDYEKTVDYVKNGTRYSEFINTGNLIDMLLFLKDAEQHIIVLEEQVNRDFIKKVVKENIDNLGRAYKEFTGKYKNYKDKTVEEKFITSSVRKAIEQYRDDVIFCSIEEYKEAQEAVHRIVTDNVLNSLFHDSVLTAQVDILYKLPFRILNEEVELKGMIDLVATSYDGYTLVDLKTTSKSPLKAFYEGKWALQAAIYSYIFANTAPDGEMLKEFIWIVYHRPTKNVYKLRAAVNGKYIKDDNLWTLHNSGQENESIIYQYLVGSESSNIMSLFDRIAWYLELEKDNFEIDPKSKEVIEIKPISPYNL